VADIMAVRTTIDVFEDGDTLALGAAKLLVRALERKKGRAGVCLSGGSTPRLLYELLAAPPLCDRVPWSRVEWFWGDERFVPPDHPDSNYRMAREAMFDVAPVPPANIHPFETVGLEPEQSAALYERTLKQWYGSEELDPARPLFHVTLLGVGRDGHTASLFPGNPALEEQRHWVTAVIGAKPEPRIGLTLKAINSSRLVIFLVAGGDKYPVLQLLRSGENLPANLIRPASTLRWLMDRAASRGEAA
jgi:6-phosphogluconolactonase